MKNNTKSMHSSIHAIIPYAILVRVIMLSTDIINTYTAWEEGGNKGTGSVN